MIFKSHPVYFATCCTEKRRPLLANEPLHLCFLQFATRAFDGFDIAVGKYVIMPDHLHLFVAGPEGFVLGQWVGTLKRVLAKHVDKASPCTPVWQRGFFDHILRSRESYSQKWNYVSENPVRAGLVKQSEDWPFSGEIVVIEGR
jgi:REP element-mobilizing transposase RayT